MSCSSNDTQAGHTCTDTSTDISTDIERQRQTDTHTHIPTVAAMTNLQNAI